jgi:hypothetical protein
MAHRIRYGILGKLSAFAVCAALGCSEDKPASSGGSAGHATGGNAVGTSGSGGAVSASGTGAGGMLGGNAGNGSGGAGGRAGTAGSGGTGGSAGSSSSGSGGGGGGGANGGGGGSGGSGSKSKTTFFVTSDTSKTGKLGGLTAADKRCQDLATKAGFGDHTFHAYLSTAAENAKDRIGKGPWVNSKGTTLAADVTALHASTLKGDHALFIDENGKEIDGQWNSSPEADWSTATGKSNQHDIFTGSKPDGTLQSGATCMDWTSDADADKGQVGHSDGMGPGMATTGNYSSWNSAHASSSCATTWKAGGAGRLYCFAID